MNDRDYLNQLADKREADARKPGITDGQRDRLLALAREHRELAKAIVLGQAA